MATLTYGAAAPFPTAGPHVRADPRPTLAGGDCNYAATADHVLIVIARQIDGQRAVRELLVRHYPWLRGVIGQRARQAGLRREDVEDAQQEAVFALLEALVDYDLIESTRPGGCSFRTFVGRRAMSRFLNELHRLRRLETHRRGEVELVAALDGRTNRLGADGSSRGWRELLRGDPALAAEWRELCQRMGQSIDQFEEKQQRLWEQAAAGVPLEQLAHEEGVSRRTVSRSNEQVAAHLRATLPDWAPGRSGSGPTT